MLRISGLTLTPDQPDTALASKCASQLRISRRDIAAIGIVRRAIDARRGRVAFVYTVDVRLCCDEDAVLRRSDASVTRAPAPLSFEAVFGQTPLNTRPVVVGSGPAGLFAALTLARYGYAPIVLERGPDIAGRKKAVDAFFAGGTLDPNANIQFGEGGAGTFSDGKLTTRIKDERCTMVLDALIAAGAPEDIRFSSLPHIGSDLLLEIMPRIRRSIEDLGGEFMFLTALSDINSKNGAVTAAKLSNGVTLDCEAMVLATGHSARDTITTLFSGGLSMEQKPFALGLRVEHLQQWVDKTQYGSYAGHPRLGAAPYSLNARIDGRSVYTFCMCPGGYVVNASSEEGAACVNGMSLSRRDGRNSNAALVCQVSSEDAGSDHPLGGMQLQRRLEQQTYRLGASRPVATRMEDFLCGRASSRAGDILPTVLPGVTFGNVADVLPEQVAGCLKQASGQFDRRMHGFAAPDALLTAIETRTSSPVRILRGEDGHSVNIKGIFPAGEGAGYAGGIVSAAVDGIRSAQALMRWRSPKTGGSK